MKILDHFRHLTLTTDQRNALEKMDEFLKSDDRAFILLGYAGSGKSTLIKGLVEFLQSEGKKFQLLAPTGRAAKVVNLKSGFESATIHRGIYSFKELEELEHGEGESDVSFLYHYKVRNTMEVHDSVLIVDEASMISDVINETEFFQFGSGHLLRDLINYGRIQDPLVTSKVIFIGDPAQLPPIGMSFSPALDSEYLRDTYTINAVQAEMKEVVRQDFKNGILHAATKIRQSLTSGYFNSFDVRGNGRDIFELQLPDFIEIYKSQQKKKIIICWKNKTAHDLNLDIRRDKFGADLNIQPSDIVINSGNNYLLGIMNGEFAVVSEVSPQVETREISFYVKGGEQHRVRLSWRNITLVFTDEANRTKIVNGYILENFLYGSNNLTPAERRALYVDFRKRHPKLKVGTTEFKDAITRDKYFNCIFLKYGYAVTCHKAQGGEWDTTFVIWDMGSGSNESGQNRLGKSNPGFYRWAYTAVTRASNKLFCINPPYFSAFSEMKFLDFNVQNALEELTGQSSSMIEVNITEVSTVLSKYGLVDCPHSIQDHFIQTWYNLRNQSVDIIGWQRIGYEIRYFFKKNEQTAAVKFWVNGQNVFKANFQKLPSQTSSDDLFDAISSILRNPRQVCIVRSHVKHTPSHVKFDQDIGEDKPFLLNLFDQLAEHLNDGETITNIQHFEFRERYTIEKNNRSCVFDFEYNKEGFFGRVTPLEKHCNSSEILMKIKTVVNRFKNIEYVN